MKKLYLMRHAKSSWDNPVPDHKRELNSRGKKDAKLIGEYLKERSIKIDKIISSDAERAKDTAKRVAKVMEIKKENLEFNRELYGANCQNILDVIREVNDEFNSILIVSHNPTVSNLSFEFNRDHRFKWLPTAGIVGFEFNIDSFKEITIGVKNRVTLFMTPKILKS